jgi:MFS family permease
VVERTFSRVGYYGAMPNERSVSRRAERNLFTREFILGFFIIFTVWAASHSLTPTLPIYLARLGSNEGKIGVLVGICFVAALTSRFFVGAAMRKFSEKSIMLVGAFLLVLTFFSYIAFRPFWPLLTVRVLQGIAFACIDTAVMTYILSAVPLVYRARAIGYLMLGPSLAMVMAAPLGVFLINRYSFTVLFLFCACLSLCTLFLSWKMKGQEHSISDMGSSVDRISFFDLKIVVPAITSFLQTFVMGALMAFFPLYAIQCGVMNPGLFFSASAVMIIAARILGGTIFDTYGKEKIILTSISISMLALIMLSFSTTQPLFIVAGLLWGTGVAFVFPANMAYALEHAGSSGATVGTYQAFMDFGMALGPVVMGIIIPITGYRIMFLCLGFTCLTNLCYFQFYVKRRRNEVPIA